VDTIENLAARGVRKLTVASPSFAVDCLETLEEVAMEYHHLFLSKGGEQLTLVPGLNDGDDHVAALTAVIKSRLSGWLN
jgi:ferrochelatase